MGYTSEAQTKIDSLKLELKKTINKNEKLEILDALTRRMIRKNDKEQVFYLEAYIVLAKEMGAYDLMASKSRFLIQQYINKGDTEKAMRYIDSMLSFKEKFKKEKSEAHILLKRAGVHFRLIAYEKSKEDYKKSAALFMKAKDTLFAADAYFFNGQAASNSSDFVDAIQSFEKAYDLYERKKDYGYTAQVGNELGIIFAKNGLKQPALKKWKETLKICKKIKGYSPIANIYLNLVGEYLTRNKISLVEKYLDSAKHSISNFRGANKLRNEFYYRLSLTKYYSKINKPFLIKNELDSIDVIESKIGTFFNSLSLYQRASYAEQNGNLALSSKLAKKYLDLTGKEKYNESRLEAEKLMADVSFKQGNTLDAYKYLKEYTITKDSLYSITTANAYAYQQTRFEAIEREKTIVKQNADIQRLEDEQKIAEAKKKMWISLFLFIISIVLGIFYYTWQRAKRKQEILAITIAKNEKELDNFTQQLLLKSKEKETLSSELEVLKAELGEKNTFNNLQELANTKILTKEDWADFKEKFNSVYPSFLIKLKNNPISITESEERLLALEKLNLNNSDIGAILGIAQKSVIITRYRLRKKLNIPKEIDLIDFMESI